MILAVLGAVLLTACSQQTTPAMTVGTTTATMTGVATCPTQASVGWAWQWRELGTTAWRTSTGVRWDCSRSAKTFPIQAQLAGLKPDTSYQYRLLVGLNQRCDMHAVDTCLGTVAIDTNGVPNGPTFDTFTTQPVCDDVQGANETLASFVGANPAGSSADPRVLCVRAGTHDVGQLNGIKSWTTLTPQGEADGTKQPVVLNGNVSLDNRGAAIEDIKVVGCYYEAGCNAQRNKTVDVKADDVRISHVEITQRGGRNGDAIQCVLVGNDHQVTGLLLEYSKSHSCGSEASGNHDHGIYCRDAVNPRLIGNWFYNNEGYGIQMWPNCDGAQVVGNVVSDNGAACEVSGASPTEMSTGAHYRNSFCGNAREAFPPMHCGPTTGNKATDIVTFGRYRNSHTDCYANDLTFTGLLETDPQFYNRGAYDLRMRSSAARAKLGIYAAIVPGPRW